MKTLEELKAENEAKDAEAAETTPIVEEEEAEEVEASEEPQEEDEAGESDSEEGGAEDVESWMQADDEASESSVDTVPLAAHVKMRAKLKGKAHGLEDEIAALKEELNRIKSGSSQTVETGKAPPMPTPDQYDYDDAKYQQAMASWVQSQVANQVQAVSQSESEKQMQAQQVEALNKAVDSHYERAAKLAKEANISPEVYQSADLSVRQTIESVLPNLGDTVTDHLISRLGEGSEKVMYFLGRNSEARDKLKLSLMQDKSGISAALYLGELKTKVSAPPKRASTAPRPAPTANGDETSLSKDEKTLIKNYKSAEKRGDAQAMFDTKRKAKANGIDTKHW